VNRETVGRLWEAHKQDGWPRISTQLEGPLMTLDTVISGCVVYFLDSEEGLDEQRRTIVGDCLNDLETIEHELEEDFVLTFSGSVSWVPCSSLPLPSPRHSPIGGLPYAHPRIAKRANTMTLGTVPCKLVGPPIK